MNLNHYIAIFIILSIHHINGFSGTTDSNSNCSEDNISLLPGEFRSQRDQPPETLTELMHTQHKLLKEKKYKDISDALSSAFYNYYKKKEINLNSFRIVNNTADEAVQSLYMDKEFSLLHLAYVREHKEEIKHITNKYSLWYQKIKADRIKESQEEAAWYWDALTTGYLPHLTTYIARKAKGIFISDSDDKSALEHSGMQLQSYEIKLAARASENARKLNMESELYHLMSAWHWLATQPVDPGIVKFQECREEIKKQRMKFNKSPKPINFYSNYPARNLQFIIAALRGTFSSHLPAF